MEIGSIIHIKCIIIYYHTGNILMFYIGNKNNLKISSTFDFSLFPKEHNFPYAFFLIFLTKISLISLLKKLLFLIFNTNN